MGKQSGYDDLGAAPADGDMVPFRDVSDTSMAATGTTKEMSVSNLLSALKAATIRALGFFDTSNDGSGSGLDADLLDGSEATAFATAAQGALADSAVQPGDDADTLGSGAATDGQVLTADGAGAAAWETVAGGGTVDTSGTPVATDYARFTDADTIEGRSPAEVRSDLNVEDGATADQTASDIVGEFTGTPDGTQFLRDDGALATPAGGGSGVDTSGTPATGEYARFTDADTIEGRTNAEVLSDIGAAASGHDLGGAEHAADTLANLNSKVSDATLDDSSDTRDPTAHASDHEPGGSDAMAVDAATGTGSLRTLGTGSQQAAAGDHDHSDAVEFVVACSDEPTAIDSTGTKVTFRLPHAMTLTGVRASLTSACSTGTFTVDVNESGTSVLSTKLTIDATETTSTTAATAAVISDSALADDAEITIDVDDAGDSTATGLKVALIGTRA